MLNIIKKKFSIIVAFIAIVIFLISSLHPTFTQDESFTFSLIQHNFHNVIYLDSMDVHPPLYYLILKSFLILTTFWTKSIFIKVYFARMFSIFIFILIIIFIKKIIGFFNIRFYANTMIIFLLLNPIVLTSVTRLRMYNISALFLIIEVYYLLIFTKTLKMKYLSICIIFTVLNYYTFYFAGLSAGLFVLIFAIIYLIHKEYNHLIKITLGALISLVLYFPWIPVLLKQMLLHRKANTGSPLSFKNIFSIPLDSFTQSEHARVGIFYFFLLAPALYCSFKYFNRNVRKFLLILLIDAIFTCLLSFIICTDKYQVGVAYPVFMIYAPVIFNLFINTISSKDVNKNICKIVTVSCILLSVITFINDYKSINQYTLPSINLYKNFNSWNNTNKRHIIINKSKYPINKSLTAFEDSIYLSSINKDAEIKGSNYSILSQHLVNDTHDVIITKYMFKNLEVK